MNSATIVQEPWNYCKVLRDDGMGCGDYVEQPTYLLFLKMADERSRPPHNQSSPITKGCDWPSLLAKDDALADSDNLPPPDVIAQEIVDDLEAALEPFRLIAFDLQADGSANRRLPTAPAAERALPLH